MNLLDTLRLHRRGMIAGASLLAALLVVLAVAVAALRLTDGSAAPERRVALTRAPSATTSRSPSGSPVPTATDAASWDAIPPVAPSTSAAYPAIRGETARDPYAFARDFATELFTRNYATSTRAELVAWTQYEDSPLQAANYPRSDWTKVLVDSLTDLTWDDATDTPIPADGPWLALQAQRAADTASKVQVSPDPVWQQHIAAGYQPPDALATDLDVTLTVTQRRTVDGHVAATKYDIAIALQLGTAANASGYGVAATNNYVIKEVG